MKTKSNDTVVRIQCGSGPFSFDARFSDQGLAGLSPASRSTPKVASRTPARIKEWKRVTQRALEAILDGRAPAALPPIDFNSGTSFQKKVWNALTKIPRGRTVGYSGLAEKIGVPRAARAVGSACGANPVPLLVPCHRVLRSNGSLGGFAWGLEWKRRLLKSEGCA